MIKYKVSVIVPVYNSEKTIDQCINSVLNQTLKSVQLILVDDGSTDNSSSIIDKYKDMPNIEIIHQENKGVSMARNRGLKVALGEYVFFLDSDDFLDLDVFEKLWDYTKLNDLDLALCAHTEYNATLYKGNNSDIESFVADNSEKIAKYFDEIFIKSVCAKFFRRELIEKNKISFPEEMTLGEDLYFVCSFILVLNKIGKIGNAFYRIQNVNPVSLSKRYVPNMESNIIKQIELWRKLISKYPNIEKSYYNDNIDIELSLSAGFFNNLYKQDCTFSRKEKYQMVRTYIDRHRDWLDGSGKGEKCPKNELQRITMAIIKSKNPFLIELFFKTKEKVKKIKFECGRKCKE